MKSTRKELWFNIPRRRGILNITPQVDNILRESGIQEGLCLVNAMNITASVFINDDERGLHQDYEEWLEWLAPHAPTDKYKHNLTMEDNADAHLKRTIMGREVVVAVTEESTKESIRLVRRLHTKTKRAGFSCSFSIYPEYHMLTSCHSDDRRREDREAHSKG